MQDAGKVVATLSVTFAVGVITGWLLNSYTRKVRQRRGRRSLRPSSSFVPLPGPNTQNTQTTDRTHKPQGLEGMLDKLSNKVKRI